MIENYSQFNWSEFCQCSILRVIHIQYSRLKYYQHNTNNLSKNTLITEPPRIEHVARNLKSGELTPYYHHYKKKILTY